MLPSFIIVGGIWRQLGQLHLVEKSSWWGSGPILLAFGHRPELVPALVAGRALRRQRAFVRHAQAGDLVNGGGFSGRCGYWGG